MRQLFFLASASAAAATALACSLVMGGPWSAAGTREVGEGAGCCASAAPPSASVEAMLSAIKTSSRMVLSPAGLPRRCHAVSLVGAAAACPDRADDLAVHDNRNAAFGCHGFFRKGRECPVARGILIRERLARTTEQHGRARLALCNLDRRQLGAVHLLEIDELAGRSHDCERHGRIAFLGLGKRGGGNGLCLFIGDRRAIVGGRRRGSRGLLRQRRAAKGQRRADAERNEGIKSHGPVSAWIAAAS